MIFTDMIINKHREILEEMKTRYANTPPSTLKEPSEIIAVGVMSGGDMIFKYENGMMTIASKGVCGAIWDGKEFRYFQNPNYSEKDT